MKKIKRLYEKNVDDIADWAIAHYKTQKTLPIIKKAFKSSAEDF